MNVRDNSCNSCLSLCSILVDDFVVALSQLAMNFHAKTYELKNFFLVKQCCHLRHELHELPRSFIGLEPISVNSRNSCIN